MKKYLIVFIIVVIVVIIAIIMNFSSNYNDGTTIIELNYEDNFTPGSSYSIKINKEHQLYTKVIHYNTTLNGKSEIYENVTDLTEEEYNKIEHLYTIIHDDEMLNSFCMALSSISQDSKSVSNYDWFKNEDFNNDGKVTCREHGNAFLDIIIEELK